MADDTKMKTSPGRLIAVIAVAAVIVCFGFYVANQVSQSADNATDAEMASSTAGMLGLNNAPTKNALDPKFTDADGDLLADAPADAKDQLDPAVLKFSYISSDDPEKFKIAFKELMAAISAATGKPVEYVEYASPDDELIAFHRGDLHIAGLNSGLVPAAVCVSGFRPSVMMADADGAGHYKAEILTTADSPVKQLSDLKGREFTFTDLTSNSGYKAALIALREAGLKPYESYSPRYSQGHLQSLEGLKSKSYENVAVASDVLKRAESTGAISKADYRSIYTSQKSFPTAAIGFRNDLKPELAKKIHDMMVAFKWTGTGLESSFGKEGRSKFVDANYKSDWEFIRQVDDNLGFPYKLPSGEPNLYVPPSAADPSTQPSAQVEQN